jgi:hypothetical protein
MESAISRVTMGRTMGWKSVKDVTMPQTLGGRDELERSGTWFFDLGAAG